MLNVSEKPDLAALKAAYLEHLVLRNMSALTVRQVDQYLRLFTGYLSGRGITEPGKVDREAFEQYKAYLSTGYVTRKGTQLKSSTVQGRLISVKVWFAWMKKKGVLFFDPLAEAQVPRTIKRLPRGVLRPDEIRKLMEQPNLKTPIGYRDRTMMEVLYASGARAAELMNLRTPDVDLKKKVVRIRNGKGGRDRFVPLTTQCCRFLERYLEEIRPELADCLRPAGNRWSEKARTGADFLFLSAYGGSFSPTWLSAVMRAYYLKAGMMNPVSPVHGLRHSLATHLMADGMDVRYVQALLGHNNINSTQIYTHVERGTLHKMLKKYHPRALTGETVQPFVEEKEEHAAAA